MDETTFRILDTLSRDLGSPVSINELTRKIRELHKTAHYKNIYDKIQELGGQDVIKLNRIGKSSVITLNFNDYRTTGKLAEMELEKERRFLENKTGMQMLLMKIKTCFQGFCINSISIISPEKNILLNRAEFLFILYEPPKKMEEVHETGQGREKEQEREKSIQNEILSIHSVMQSLEKAHNMKLDCLVLRGKDFLSLLKESQSNPLKVMLPYQIAFFHPQDYWIEIKEAIISGIGIRGAEEVNPAKISEQDLAYNMSRFGYKEMGTRISKGRELCLEYIIVSILIKDDARRIEAIPILLAKNKPRYNLLIFLCKKYEKLEKMLGLLKVLNKIVKSKETGNAIKILETIKIRGKKADEKAIIQKMRLYHAI
jgi:hypothetical protein